LNDGDDDEEVELTHLGQSLAQIEKFEKIRMSDDEDDDDDPENPNGDKGRINGFIKDMFFFKRLFFELFVQFNFS
jgi:hypothetical protein